MAGMPGEAIKANTVARAAAVPPDMSGGNSHVQTVTKVMREQAHKMRKEALVFAFIPSLLL